MRLCATWADVLLWQAHLPGLLLACCGAVVPPTVVARAPQATNGHSAAASSPPRAQGCPRGKQRATSQHSGRSRRSRTHYSAPSGSLLPRSSFSTMTLVSPVMCGLPAHSYLPRAVCGSVCRPTNIDANSTAPQGTRTTTLLTFGGCGCHLRSYSSLRAPMQVRFNVVVAINGLFVSAWVTMMAISWAATPAMHFTVRTRCFALQMM